MIDVARFKSFEAGTLFTGEPSLDLRTGSFDMEYQGGSWDFDQLEGVEALYGQKVPDRLGVLSLVAAPDANATRATGPFVRADWARRANRAAVAIGLPPLLGQPESELLKAFPTLKAGENWDDGVRHFVSGDAGDFHVEGVVHGKEGLLRLELRHVSTVASNRHSR
jgi:hypothetical protein